MNIKIGFDIQLAIESPMALIYLLHVHPSRQTDLWAPEVVGVQPNVFAGEYLDAFGNQCGRVNAFAGVSQVRLYSESVIRDSGLPDEVNPAAWQHDPTYLPADTLQFLLPSRYCEVDSELLPFAWMQFGSTLKGWRERVGVCRDYTHLAVTLCRCLNIPARYCTGYLGDIGIAPVPYPMDFSAWFEVFLDGRWYPFDARHNTPRIGRILMARGRDAGDVPITMAFGLNTLQKFQVTTYEVDSYGNAV